MGDLEKILLQIGLSFVFGTIGAGFFSFYKRRKEAKIDAEIEADEKLERYSKSLWFVLKELEFRLKHFKNKLENDSEQELNGLKFVPDSKTKIDWYSKDGYYITSTLYLFCSLSSWITIYQRDIVYLKYDKASLSAEFQKHIENLKAAISNTKLKSCMWYHYFASIGEFIVDKSSNSPIPYSDFVLKLVEDEKFLSYMEQSFHFLNFLSTKESIQLIAKIIEETKDAKAFLKEHNSIPV